MSEIRFKLSGLHAVIGLALFALFVVARIAMLGETDDPELHEAIQRELQSDLGGRTGQELKNLDTTNHAAVASFVDRADPDAIEVQSASVSKPLLTVGTSARAVVRIEYSLPGGPRETVYWRFDHSAIAGWRYRQRTIAAAYYLNFF